MFVDKRHLCFHSNIQNNNCVLPSTDLWFNCFLLLFQHCRNERETKFWIKYLYMGIAVASRVFCFEAFSWERTDLPDTEMHGRGVMLLTAEITDRVPTALWNPWKFVNLKNKLFQGPGKFWKTAKTYTCLLKSLNVFLGIEVLYQHDRYSTSVKKNANKIFTFIVVDNTGLW